MQCPCGVLGACESQGACTCDGSGKGSDMLTLTSADTQLPLTHIMADRISKTLSFTVSALKCAPVQIGEYTLIHSVSPQGYISTDR